MNGARFGTGFRWRSSARHGAAADLVRVRDDRGSVVAALANGFDCGFAMCWPLGARLLLDAFDEHWDRTSGDPAARLERAFDGARLRFCAEAASLIPDDSDFPDAPPAAVLVGAVVAGAAVHVRWIGGDVAFVVRGSDIIGQTTPHTLREEYRRDHPEADPNALAFPNVLSRTIGPAAPDSEAPDSFHFAGMPGDTLVLLSKANYRGPCLQAVEVARLVRESSAPAESAEALADLGFTSGDPPFAAVATVELGGPG